MTKSKNKVSLLGLVIAFVFMVAGIFMFVPNNIATVSAQDLDKDIHFSLATSNEKLVFAPGAQTVGAVTITYTVVNTNDGINNLVFIPAYNHDVFAIDEITVNADTNLGDATITNGYSSYTGDYVKLAFDSTTLFDAENVTLVTITYNTKEDLTYLNNGSYNFSLVLNYTDLTQTRSTAYYILGDENLGEQEEVEIIVDDVNVELFIQQSGSLNITDATVEYDANPVGISLDGENEVNYSFTGNGNITWTWYSDENYQNEISAPTNAGTYYLKGTMATTDVYVGATVQSAVTVNKKAATVVIDNKTSAYGDAIVELTHQAPTGLIGEDTLVINLSTTATSSSPAGTYSITGTVGTGSNPNYNVTFTDGTYTITARAITIKANDQSAQYTGSEPTVDQTAYTVTGATIESGVTITKQAGVNVGSYTLTPSYTNSNYSITFENGTFYITSVGKDAEYIFSFFSGDTVTYDTNSHDLLVVNNQIPSWIAYQPSNNVQTNANSYTIGITVTLSAQDAANYTNGVTQFNSTVTGTITPYAITVTADNKSHVYGNTPATLTPVEAGLTGDKVTVTFTVYKDYKGENEEAITLSSSTPVGTYTIVPSATSTNYAFTFGTGTYTVTKATPVLSLVALDTNYNDHLYFANASITVGSQVLEIGDENVYGFEYRIEIYNANNQKVLNDAWITENYWLDAGVYTAKLVLEGTDNYNGAVYEYISEEDFDTQFTIEKVLVGAPTVEYNGATATWSVVSKDEDDKDLHNATVTYTISGTEYANRSFTANAKGTYTLVITPSNTTNYMENEVELEPVYSVTFTEGTHNANTATPTNMPAVQYVFKGQKTTAPATNPSLTGYTFAGWDFNFNDYIIEDMVDDNGNLNIPATWTINQVTMTVVYVHSANNTYVETSKTFNANYNSNVVISESNLIEKAHITDIVSQYNLNGMKYTYNGFWNYKVTGEDVYIRENVTDIVVNATQNYTFVARYNATPIVYDINYFYSFDGAQSTQYTIGSAAYGSTINYLHVDSMKWFRVEAWYLDEARTQVAPVTMPAHDITVYGALVFNVGKGDVNGDGNVDTDDITLYRQWIVGGYTMTVLSNNEELYEAAEAETEEPSNTIYYIKRVADINIDLSRDIRDVSITRMSIAGGYKWDIVTGENVTGEEIIRNVYSANIDSIEAALLNGGRATVYADITDTTKEIEIVKPESIYIDLNGHTVYIKSFVVRTTGVNATITVLNGTIKTTDGITIAAPNGNVILQDLEGWVNDNKVNLQAASNSLHIKQNVAFYNYAYEQQANQQEMLTVAPAVVNVAKDTHVHVEENADLVVEKLVVTEQNFTAIEEIAEATISITVDSEVTNVIKVEGTCDVKVAEEIEEVKVVTPVDEAYETIDTAKKYLYITNEQELNDALAVGGEILIGANINLANRTYINKNVNIDLNGYTISGRITAEDGNVTLNNGKIVARLDAYYNVVLTLGAKLTVENNVDIDDYAVVVWGNESQNLNPELHVYGTVIGKTNGAVAISGNGTDLSNAVCVIHDGANISSTNDVAIYWPNAGTLTVKEGATVTGATAIYVKSGTVNIEEDANITSNLTEKVAYNFNGNGAYATGDAIVIDNCDYPGGSAVVTIAGNYDIGRYYYIRTAEQLAHVAQVGGKAQLAANINMDSYIVVRKNLVLDLNNKTISGCIVVYNCEATLDNGKIVGEVDAYDGAVLTLGAKLTVEINKRAVVVWGDANNNLNPVLNVYGTVRATNTNAVAISGNGTDKSNAVCNIYDGAVVTNTTNVAIYWPNAGTLNIKSGATVTGTTAIYVKSGVLNVEANANITSNLTEKVQYRYNGNGAYATGDAIVIDNCDYPGGNAVVTISGEYDVETYWYVKTEQQLRDALAVGGKIQLGANIELTEQVVIDKDVTLDLNGKTICYVGSTEIKSGLLGVKRGATLTINDTVGTGKINASQKVYAAVALTILGESATGEKAALIVNGGTLEGYYFAVTGNGNRHNTEITINNGTLYGLDGTAIYNPQDGLVTINNGHLKGYETAIEIRAGHLVINGGEFEALAEASSQAPNGSGTTTVGAIIAVSQHTTLKEINVEINDGTFVNGINSLVVYDSTGHNKELITVTITGGTFKDNPAAYVAEGYKSVYLENEQHYCVVDKDAVIGSAGSMIESEEGEF